MAKGKAPAFQFYTGDWKKDPLLSMCSPATRGIWIDLLCAMWDDNKSGVVKGTVCGLARICRCTPVEMANALEELEQTKTAEIKHCNENVTQCNKKIQKCNGYVTVICRRMAKEHKDRNNNKIRVRKYRENKGDMSNVTDMSHSCNAPSSSSSSTSVKKINKKKELCTPSGAPEKNSEKQPAEIEKQKRKKYSDEFERWWKLYPQKVAKKNAHAEWKKIKPDKELQAIMSEKLAEWKAEKEKCDAENIFFPDYPHPERWIKNRRWEDDISSYYRNGKPRGQPNDLRKKNIELDNYWDNYQNQGKLSNGRQKT